MITAKINPTTPGELIPEFPVLAEGIDSGNIYLRLSKDKAVCLSLGTHNDGAFRIGEYVELYVASFKQSFEGSITLRNA